ncbi:TetR/AcrR family transcriptional repressor of lmrAB and yxaGH operons [Saccharothrix tamanrassetensis]|uniref:TetR/AcrR family transcriptional repressor of lmrAB and yxaGH operons n=1 Tax=Saccharothrix tamanrassetensis TaxID=1051531 RepID=A0A841CK69_9PSEU|nr:TetR/AcrR family transcriptional regulator [Saccharothrix tamanrassetensis]MBB5956487.1 TetR/AcrR family transcriptional repressor of lmrAB and yxaGH operons [Saccharothrix tamanrassetensis]
MPRRTDTRERMVRTAADLFHAQGYHATGLNQVLAEGGAPKGSLYFHFPGGKEQLAVEAVALAGDDLRTALEAVLSGTDDPVEGLNQALALLGENLERSDFKHGCPIATVALDASADSEPIREACADVYDSWQRIIAEHLNRHVADEPAAGEAGTDEPAAHQSAPGEAATDELATVVLAAIEGAVLLARTRRDLSPLHAVGARLGALLGRPTG